MDDLPFPAPAGPTVSFVRRKTVLRHGDELPQGAADDGARAHVPAQADAQAERAARVHRLPSDGTPVAPAEADDRQPPAEGDGAQDAAGPGVPRRRRRRHPDRVPTLIRHVVIGAETAGSGADEAAGGGAPPAAGMRRLEADAVFAIPLHSGYAEVAERLAAVRAVLAQVAWARRFDPFPQRPAVARTPPLPQT